MEEARRSNRFTELVGCRLPIQLAVMGGVVDARLAGAVTHEGGLGMLSGTLAAPEDLIDQIARATTLAGVVPGSTAPVGVGFLMPFVDPATFGIIAGHADLVEGFYGDPDAALIERAHADDVLVSWQVGSVEEARVAIDTGCDLVVVQGVEAGGHVRGPTLLDELLALVRPLTAVPLVAAGGIGTPARAAELFDAGADAVRLGTRFLACVEADVHPDYLDRLVAAEADDTEVTETFSLAWPDAPHRVLRNCIDASDDEPALRSPLPPGREFTGDVASAALYAGCSVGSVVGPVSVAEVMAEFATACPV